MTAEGRILVFLEHPSPHNRELLKGLCGEMVELSVAVWYRRTDDDGRGWLPGNQGEVAPACGYGGRVGFWLFGPKPVACVVCGYRQKQFVWTILMARLLGARVFIRLDVSDTDDLSLHPLKRVTRRFAIRALVGRKAVALAIGQSNLRFWDRLGLDRIAMVPYAPAKHDGGVRTNGSDGSEVLAISVARLSPEKGIVWAAECLLGLERLKGRSWRWILVGTGPDTESLNRLINGSWLKEHVEVVGAKPYSELGTYYAVADVLIVPSFREAWGLVVAEGARAGCRLLVSDRVPSVEDVGTECDDDVFVARDPHSFRAAFVRQLRLGKKGRRKPRYTTSSSATGQRLADVLKRELSK